MPCHGKARFHRIAIRVRMPTSGKYLSYAAHHNTKARKQAHRTVSTITCKQKCSHKALPAGSTPTLLHLQALQAEPHACNTQTCNMSDTCTGTDMRKTKHQLRTYFPLRYTHACTSQRGQRTFSPKTYLIAWQGTIVASSRAGQPKLRGQCETRETPGKIMHTARSSDKPFAAGGHMQFKDGSQCLQ